jgi:hypothetical protein
MDLIDGLKAVGDLGVNALLLLVLWQGLKRFDLLLNLVITLAARSKLTTDEIEQIRAQVFGSNGKVK